VLPTFKERLLSMTTPSRTEDAEAAREEMISCLEKSGDLRSPAVAAAFRAVPRHLFAPEASVEEAYRPFEAVITKRDRNGVSMSSVSAPQVQAFMIEQAGVAPGMKVLEVGSGGYNAALLAEIVGSSGQVTSVDIDPDVTARAIQLLAEAGYPQVRVVLADAEQGVADAATFDRIIVTAGAWDIAPSWITQLVPGGRLVVPLRMRGLTRSVALTRIGDHLESDSARVCGFVPMQGEGEHSEELLLVTGTPEIGLRFDDEVLGEPSALDNAVRTPRYETWTGVRLGRQEPFDTLQLYLATVLDGFCVMAVDPDLDSGLVVPVNKYFSLAAVDGGSFGYITWQRTEDDTRIELGVHALGPQAPALAEAMAGHVRRWDREHRGGPGPRIAVYPAATPDDRLPGDRAINKRHSRVTLSWSETTAAADQGPAPTHR
jgi:protein-L-isoaspartate(D-aspartate) O-methyltransferase